MDFMNAVKTRYKTKDKPYFSLEIKGLSFIFAIY